MAAAGDPAELNRAVAELVLTAPLELSEPELVDLLEFIFQQHASTTPEGETTPRATALSVDNTDKKEQIIKFLHEKPFAISKKGIARCVSRARRSTLSCYLTRAAPPAAAAVAACASCRSSACRRPTATRRTLRSTSCGCSVVAR